MKLHSPIFRKLLWITLIPTTVTLLLSELYLSRYIRSAVSLQTVDAAIAGFQWRILGLSLIGAVAGFALAYLLSRSLTRRISLLREFSEKLGKSGGSAVPPPEPDDELGALARSFYRMSDQLRDFVGHLSEESERRETILASMVEGVVAVDHDLKVTFYNNSFRRLVGLAAPAGEPVPFVELVRDSGLVEILKEVLASQKSVNRRLQLPSAESRLFEAHAGPLGGSLRKGAIVILHDITELDRLERVRKDFVANVSHELRTPLTAICGYAEALLDGGLEDRQNNRRFVEIIEAHAKRINNIASDLLILSELQSAKPAAQPERILVRDALETAIRTIEPEARERKIKLVYGTIEDTEVMGNRVQLEQAVLNLLQNAVKFNRPGGNVHLSAARKVNSKVCITIADTGVGIPSEDLSRIFERFYRVDKARSREVGGTGLGLSIVKHAIERMNGTVEVESQLGKGSEFKILLPLTISLSSPPVACFTDHSDEKN